MKKFINYYYVLGLSPYATRREIRLAYEEKGQLHNGEQQELCRKAYTVLFMPSFRERYDEEYAVCMKQPY